MSVEIDTAFVQHYAQNVTLLAQQKGSRLRDAVRVESITGRNGFFDQIGQVAARRRTTRHADTPRMDTPHARRRVSLVDYDWADLIDQEDKVRMLTDPTSAYARAAAWAMGRAMDDALIEAADGIAYSGQDGSTATNFDSAMVIDVQVGGSASDVGLNIEKLLAAKETLDSNDVDPDVPRFMAVNAKQLKNLLGETQVQSADYNSVKALVQGDIDTFLGFRFIRTERIGIDSASDHKVLYWARDGLLLALGQEPQARISERDDKNYAMQVFYSMAIGASRMEESQIGYIACDPS
ncbi:MAG: phage capsid protein [Alphaproteobacteria bacterium]